MQPVDLASASSWDWPRMGEDGVESCREDGALKGTATLEAATFEEYKEKIKDNAETQRAQRMRREEGENWGKVGIYLFIRK